MKKGLLISETLPRKLDADQIPQTASEDLQRIDYMNSLSKTYPNFFPTLSGKLETEPNNQLSMVEELKMLIAYDREKFTLE